jgi:hypothetical protein
MADKDIFEIIIEIIVLIMLVKPMFGLGILTGFGFVFAIVGSIRDGSLFTKKNMARYILGGTILTYAAGQIFFVGLKSKDILSFVIILLVGLSIWFKGYLFKRGMDI